MRDSSERASCVFRFADVEVREREFCSSRVREALPVEPKAFRVLLILLRNPGNLITKEELLDAVWNDVAVSENSLTRSVALLRRVLGDDTRDPRYIETVATIGYRCLCGVDVSEETDGKVGSDNPTPMASLGPMLISAPRVSKRARASRFCAIAEKNKGDTKKRFSLARDCCSPCDSCCRDRWNNLVPAPPAAAATDFGIYPRSRTTANERISPELMGTGSICTR